jgi:dipeptidase
MYQPYQQFLLCCTVLLLSTQYVILACTTLVCGRHATTDGSVLASHSSDGGGTLDPRLVRIPARDFPAGATRPVFASPENYPRYSGTERGTSEYFPENCQSTPDVCAALTPIGYIPQVSHTFAYFESTYGIQNEHQVGLAESTCSAVFSTTAVDNGGAALLSIDQLSHLAMERATTSREAVSLMGSLAEEFGFYGESSSFEGGAESLLVTDPTEGFIFHILPDPSGTSAIWVAQRVPDDSCAVVANMFVVREVNLTDTENFLGTASMWETAAARGLWSEGQPQDFTATFSDGEYSHKYYTGRRVWGAYRLLAPEVSLPALYENLKEDRPYPVSSPVSTLLSPADLFAVHRDWYSGTPYDPSEPGVLAGGAFGTPDRYGGGEGEGANHCSVPHLEQLRGAGSRVAGLGGGRGDLVWGVCAAW